MIIQEIIIGLIFIAALSYLGVVFWRRTKKDTSGCGESCKGCATIDIENIEVKK